MMHAVIELGTAVDREGRAAGGLNSGDQIDCGGLHFWDFSKGRDTAAVSRFGGGLEVAENLTFGRQRVIPNLDTAFGTFAPTACLPLYISRTMPRQGSGGLVRNL